jgi:hypothetical protein
MKRTILPALLTMCLAASPTHAAPRDVDAVVVGEAPGSVPVPPEVKTSAVTAVNALGKEVVVGRFQVAIDRMYPAWKDSLAKAVGGHDKLTEQFSEVPRKMAQQGMAILSFETEGEPVAYEVDSGKEPVIDANGKPVFVDVKGKPMVDAKGNALPAKPGDKPLEKMIFKKWLLVVPTVTEFRLTEPAKAGQAPKIKVAVNHSFQIAISDKGKNDWTFIDGSGLRVSELRRLFFTLPENMTLPEIKGEEKKAAK